MLPDTVSARTCIKEKNLWRNDTSGVWENNNNATISSADNANNNYTSNISFVMNTIFLQQKLKAIRTYFRFTLAWLQLMGHNLMNSTIKSQATNQRSSCTVRRASRAWRYFSYEQTRCFFGIHHFKSVTLWSFCYTNYNNHTIIYLVMKQL